jgi:hypothetical protein
VGIRAKREPLFFHPLRRNLDGARFAGGVVVEAAPAVVFWTADETASDWIPVNVLGVLGKFSGGESVEVVVARLPELLATAFEEFGGFAFDDTEEGGEGAGAVNPFAARSSAGKRARA